MLRDCRHAVRSLRRSPGFTALAVITLGLGIGASAAIFTLLDAIVLNPLQYPDSRRLAWVESSVPGTGPDAVWGVSAAGYFEFGDRLTTISSIGAWSSGGLSLARDEGAEGITAASVTASLLPMLGATPQLGRLIDESDTRPGAADVTVLSHGSWVTRYGSDPSIVGRSVLLEGSPVTVIGVMAPNVDLPSSKTDLWLPLMLDRAAPPVNAHWLSVVAQVKPGVAIADLQADLNRVTETFPERFPQAYSAAFMRETQFATATRSLRDEVAGSHARTLWILLVAVGLVLCIAAANVAALLLVRAESRRTELRIRSALGASRGRIAAHLVAEGVIIALGASALGIALATAALKGLVAIAPGVLPRLGEVAVGPATVGFGLVVALLAGIATGVLPALHFNAAAPLGGLSGISVGRIHGQNRPVTRNALVVSQMALAVMLLASAGLMLRSFEQLRTVDPGLNPRGLLTVELSLPFARYRDFVATAEYYRTLSERVNAIPGVETSGVLSDLPIGGFGGCSSVFIEGQPLGPDDNAPCVATAIAAPGTFPALGVSIHGAAPDWNDLAGGSGAIVVTPALARRLWPGENPIGKGIRGNGEGPPYYRVVGLTSELRARGLEEAPTEAVFYPLLPIDGAPLWRPLRSSFLFVRTGSDDPAALTGAIRAAIADLDPLVATGSIETMDQVIRGSASMARVSLMMILLGVAAAMALTLSIVSTYGVISYLVGQRRAELGLRMVLGATRQHVTGLVVRHALVLAGTGLALGLVGSLILGRTLRSLLFEVSPADPLTLVAVSLVLLSVGGLAAWLPAYRAGRLDPMVALRGQ